MKSYFVRVQNSTGSSWSSEYGTLHDAETEIATLKKVNALIDESLQFHGWVTEWRGYSLDDGSWVTESSTAIMDF